MAVSLHAKTISESGRCEVAHRRIIGEEKEKIKWAGWTPPQTRVEVANSLFGSYGRRSV